MTRSELDTIGLNFLIVGWLAAVSGLAVLYAPLVVAGLGTALLSAVALIAGLFFPETLDNRDDGL